MFDGPNWEEDRAKIYGTNTNGPVDPAPQIVQDSIPAIEHLANNPLQAVAAYGQTSLSSRFQRYNPNWFSDPLEVPKAELMDYSLVREMKVAMYVGLFDDTCPLVKAEEQRQTMGETVAHYVVAPW